MAHTMGGKTLTGDRGAASGRQAKVFLDDGSYAEARKGKSSLIDEKAIHRGWSGPSTMLIPVELKELDGRWPEGIEPCLIAFSENSDSMVWEIKAG